MKVWGERITGQAHATAERFTSSLRFDRRLWPHDIAGSIAWARALERAAVIDARESAAIACSSRARAPRASKRRSLARPSA